LARSFIAARSSSVNLPLAASAVAVVVLVDFWVSFMAGFLLCEA